MNISLCIADFDSDKYFISDQTKHLLQKTYFRFGLAPFKSEILLQIADFVSNDMNSGFRIKREVFLLRIAKKHKIIIADKAFSNKVMLGVNCKKM